jgi:hypothetical protein
VPESMPLDLSGLKLRPAGRAGGRQRISKRQRRAGQAPSRHAFPGSAGHRLRQADIPVTACSRHARTSTAVSAFRLAPHPPAWSPAGVTPTGMGLRAAARPQHPNSYLQSDIGEITDAVTARRAESRGKVMRRGWGPCGRAWGPRRTRRRPERGAAGRRGRGGAGPGQGRSRRGGGWLDGDHVGDVADVAAVVVVVAWLQG